MIKLVTRGVPELLLLPRRPTAFIKDSGLIGDIKKAFKDQEKFADWYAMLNTRERREVDNQIKWMASQTDVPNVADAFHFSMALFRASSPKVRKALVRFVCRRASGCRYLSDESIAEAKSALKSLKGGQTAELEFTTRRRRN